MDVDRTWFDRIYRMYWDKLVALAYYLLGDRALAEDMTQNVFLTLCLKQDALKNHPNIQGWLIQTMRYQIKNESQRAFRSLETALEPTLSLPAPQSDVADSSGFWETLPKGLSQQDQELLYLFLEVGLTHKEIAQKLGCSEEACRMRLYRAKARCKELLLEGQKKFL